jgi:FdhD protein
MVLFCVTSDRTIERLDVARGARLSARDALVDEGPLEIRARGRRVATVLRTPGADVELVRGLAVAEGIAGAAAVRIEPAGDDAVEIDVPPEAFGARSLVATAACGLCGRATIADLEQRLTEVASDLVVPAAVVAALPDRLRAAQAVFAATGGLHAAALFDPAGELLAVREDVGRHNALDKLVGWAAAAGRLPLGAGIVVVSGRLGYELAQKAVAAGAPVIAAVSAPSALAVDVCERFGVAACGFVRDGRMNVYCHGWRIQL